jgi:acetyl-CoA carboxylase/biotin carboxylase 1
VIPTSTNKATIFKFEIKPFTPLYPNTVQNPTKPERVIYFLSVLNQLDLFRCEEILRLHKQHANPQAKNTFLFVAFPKGENGFNTAITLPEAELRKLGLMLKEEITQSLQRSGFQNFGVDLMLSRPAHPPLYTQFDFSAKEKLELYRLPSPTENISVSNSPYLLFKYNEKGIVRLFTRYLLRDVASVVQVEKYSRSNPTDLLKNKLVDVIDGACGEIRVSTHSDKTITINDCNHILVCIDYDPSLNTSQWWKASVQAIQQCEPFLIKHRVTEVEIVYKDSKQEKNANGKAWESIKVVYTNETGAISEYAVYQVNEDKLKPLTHVDGPCRNAGESVSAAHHPIPQVQVQKKRFQAHKLGTTYVYDFPVVFGRAILDAWKHYKQSDPSSFNKILDTLPEKQLKALANHDYHGFVQAREMLLDDKTEELTLCDDEEILRRRANSAENDRGMIAWKMDLWTPDAPKGRSIVVIANDITYQMGSFSMREHQMYQKASEYSRLHKLPRVYIAANSGARIGFAMDIKKRLNVVWKDQNNPIEVKYLSVDNDGENDPILEQVEHTLVDGNQRIDAVIGKENDIGVENLVGSGLIAGETSAAYKEVPTYCLVTGRAVGIGAYVARLSHRIVQVENSHLILTGAPALNSLLGREIYASNGQLGGIQIMHRNGVSHAVAQNDLEGVNTVLRWISFLPVPTSNEETPKLQPMLKDDAARNVLSATKDGEQDIRSLLDPVNGGGLFDKNSFDEIMSDWAKTIVTGRARIRGLPVGVVAVETRTVKSEIPADPATADSQAKMLEQAGRVWYPDSAYKTAEAINDFNHERIPLIFVANIRGFSGGQKDMFDMVLKFGACIVDALQSYTQPIIVYIPPNGELRGGAWAVLDTQINPTCITMLADPDSRGGVLEPKGIVEIKFRAHDLKALMKKCDPLLSRLEKEVENDKHSADEREQLKREIEKRREFLMPIYRTISEKFADLHDTTGRMLAKGAIHDEVPWTEARDYFYELLQVELAKMSIAREYLLANGKSEPLGIEELSVGYKWVEEHLKEQSVSFVRPVQGKSEGRHRRHEYFSQQIVSYAQCENFKRVLEQIVVRRSSSLLQNKLGLMAENTRQNLISEILTSAGETVRNKVLIEQIAALSVEERKNLLKQFT